MIKIVTLLLVIIFLGLQYHLWIGRNSLSKIDQLERRNQDLKREIAQLKKRNREIAANILDLKQGEEAIEERARNEMGLVKPGEVFYQVIEEPSPH